MDNNESFYAYYKSNILPELNQFEQYRKLKLSQYKVWKIIHIASVIVLLIIMASFFAYLQRKSYLPDIIEHYFMSNNVQSFFFINIVIVISSIFSRKKAREILLQFNYQSKSQLFSKIIGAYSNFKYYPFNGIDQEYIFSSNLFHNFDKIQSEDYIQGIYKNLEIKLSEIELIKITPTKQRIGQNYIIVNEESSVFKGLFMVVDIMKKFSSNTYIIANTWLKILNNLPNNLERVTLEDPKFEREFDVYSNNQIEARYLLTPGFMERLLTISEKHKIRCCFINGQLLMGVSLTEDFLPNLELKKALDYQVVEQVKNQIDMFLEIIDTLKLENNVGL